ncbi:MULTISPECIES: nitrilase-related carbon-nitrogen hydrolase [unclassified Brevundimonas]|uniref:nitrilase-related carbon-nitrogen hydrolase n=1 Tax=unclassified Brevundimonas TaxID=2622653 RepID=UPI0025C48EAB|nr:MULTISPECIES: nitrilase-related carbon-nitrogen hydrolase [unclassified Brevundimonas]
MKTKWALLGLWFLGCGFAMHMVGNAMWVAAPWMALLLMLRFVRDTPAKIGLPLGAAGWALAHYAGWQGVLPLGGWMQWALPAAVGAMAFMPFAIDRLLGGYVPQGTRWLVLPLGWVVTEAAIRLLGFGTWGALAYSQHGQLALLQGMAVLGLAWPALVIGAFASIANGLWEQPRRTLGLAVAYGLVLAITVIAGLARLHPSEPQDQGVRIAGVVVDNREAFRATWGPLNNGRVLDADALEQVRPTAKALFANLMEHTRSAVAQGAGIVVWSEGNALVPAMDEAQLLSQARQLAREERVWLFIAMAVMEPGLNKAKNTVVVIDDRGTVVDRYLKSHPTPSEASVKGDGLMRIIETPHGRIALAICYDFDYPELIAQAGRAGADVLLDPSWDSPGMTPLHSHMAVARSIETGAALFRPVNDGLSIATDGKGRTVSSLSVTYGQSVVWTVQMPMKRQWAVYPWVEPFVGAVAAGMMAALLACGMLLAPRRRASV